MCKYISFILLLIAKVAASQQPVLQWVKPFVAHNGTNNPSVYSNGRSVAVDQKGNVYSAGLFNHTTDFDPGPGVFTLSTTNWAESGIYISKLSATGNFVWAIQIPALVEFGNIEITVDKNDNIYLASELRDSADFDPGPGVYMVTPIGAIDAFVAKYDYDGHLIWAKQFGGPGDTVPRSDILDIDNDNNVIVCGNFNRTIDFDPGPNVFNITSSAHIQSFIVKLTNNGDFIWAKQFGNSPIVYSGCNITDVKCDPQGYIYLVGSFTGNADFDPGPANYALQSKSDGDGYIAKLDGDGQFVWAKRIGISTDDYYGFARPRGIDLDAGNNVYTTGTFIGTLDFDPGENTHVVTSTVYDWYVLKLNAQGDFAWADVFNSIDLGQDMSLDVGYDIAVDNIGDVYAIGGVGREVDMDPGPGTYNITTIGTYGAAALVKLNSNGSFLSAGLADGTGSAFLSRMVVDVSRNIYFTGYFYGAIDFDFGPNTSQPDAGGYTPFVVKYEKCTRITTSTIDITTCSNYTLNNEIFDSSGTYTRTLMNSNGCDSIITLHLSVNKMFKEKSITICQGESFFAGGASQTISGNYKDTLMSSLNCDSIITTHLTVNPAPLPDLGPDRNLCAGKQIVVTPGLFTKYLWQDMSNKSDYSITTSGVFSVEVTNNFNCKARDTIVLLSVLPLPANFLKEKDSICNYERLEITSVNAYTSYQWSTGLTERKIMVEQPGTYWLTVRDASGCSGTDSITVFPKQCMRGAYFPNEFTPNGDGKNDIFRPLFFGKVDLFRFVVYNNFGEPVYQTTELQKGWNGTVARTSQPIGVFVWICSYQLEGGKPETKRGTVTLIR